MKSPAVLQHVSQNVRHYRSLKGLSQQQLADLAGLSRRMVAGVESGQDNISLAKLSLIADVLEVDFVQIIAAPEQQGQAVVNILAWHGTQAHSEAKLMASAAATQKVELWTWVLAPNEHYSAEPDPVGWREMLYVMEIILIGYFVPTVDIGRVTVIQLAVASVLAFAAMPLAGEHRIPDFSWPLLSIALGLGLASAVIQYVMNWAQRSVSPSQAAIIYAGEPVWAALFGRLAGERLAPLALLGGLLVVFGIMISEWKPKLLKSKKNVEQL